MTDFAKSKPLVIYHGGCRDGFCAAWVVNRWLRSKGEEGEFFAGYYGQSPPDCRGRVVIIVDFSYPLETMKAIASDAVSLLVLDHHKTAKANLEEFAKSPPEGTRVVFDMDQSGAGLAWSSFFAGDERPYLVDYVEDRDLWRHVLPDSKAVNAYIGTLPFEFTSWDEAFTTSQQDIIECQGDRVCWARQQGMSVTAKIAQYVAEVRKNAMRTPFEGYTVPIVNAPQVDISELLHELANGETFAMGWWQRSDGVFQYSLRSHGDFDVSALAKRYGGGGHRNAAGFESDHLLHIGLGTSFPRCVEESRG